MPEPLIRGILHHLRAIALPFATAFLLAFALKSVAPEATARFDAAPGAQSIEAPAPQSASDTPVCIPEGGSTR